MALNLNISFEIFALQKSIISSTSTINLFQERYWLLNGLSFNVNYFFNNFLLIISIHVTIVQLSFDKKSQSIVKILNQDLLIWHYCQIKFFQDELKVLQVSGLIHNFLKLVLISLSNLTLDYIYKCLELSQAIVKTNFECLLYKGSTNNTLKSSVYTIASSIRSSFSGKWWQKGLDISQ